MRGLAGTQPGRGLLRAPTCAGTGARAQTPSATRACPKRRLQAVVFLTFWQSVAINLAVKFGWLKVEKFSTYDTDDVAAGLQNFLICIEMFVAAIAHAHAFPPRVRAAAAARRPACRWPSQHAPPVCLASTPPPAAAQPPSPQTHTRAQDYMDPESENPGFLRNVKVMFDVRDVVDDVQGRRAGRGECVNDGRGGLKPRQRRARVPSGSGSGRDPRPRACLTPSSLTLAACADVVTDTRDDLAAVGRRTWKHAKSHTANLVQSPPSYIKGLFARDRQRCVRAWLGVWTGRSCARVVCLVGGERRGGGGKLACRGMSGQPHSRRRSRLWPAHNAPAICRAAAPTALDRAATRRRSLAARSAARDPFCLNNHRSKIRRRAAAMRRRAAARSVSLADHATMRGTLPDSNSCHLCRDCEGASGHFQLSMCHSISFNAQQVVSSRGGLSNAGWKGFRPGLSQQLPRPRLTTRGHGVGFGRLLH